MHWTGRLVVACGLILSLSSCGNDSNNPNAPQGGTTPTPAPTPTPTPTPEPTPETLSCTLDGMSECAANTEGPKGCYGCCCEENTDLHGFVVVDAINIVQRERPELFSGDRIASVQGFIDAVCEEIENMGLCCTQGPPFDEIGVKDANDFSEQFDIVLGDPVDGQGFVNPHGYALTCRPARF